MSRAKEATFVLPCDSPPQAKRLADVLAVEARAGPPRTSTTIEARATDLVIRIEADDTRGLRAAANSYLRWAQTALDVARIAERRGESLKAAPDSSK